MNMTQISLYSVSNEITELLNQVDDDGVYPDGIIDALAQFDAKGTSVTAYLLNLEAEAAMIRDAATKIGKRADPIEARAKRLREYLMMSMKRTGITEIKSPEFAVKLELERDASVDVFDAAQLPSSYMRIPEPKPAPDKTAIKKALTSGVDVPGARIVKNDRLSIK
jgi:Siphovirus Gp157